MGCILEWYKYGIPNPSHFAAYVASLKFLPKNSILNIFWFYDAIGLKLKVYISEGVFDIIFKVIPLNKTTIRSIRALWKLLILHKQIKILRLDECDAKDAKRS